MDESREKFEWSVGVRACAPRLLACNQKKEWHSVVIIIWIE